MSKYTKKKGIHIKKIKKHKKKIYQISYKDQSEALKKNIVINYPFYIISIICIYLLSRKPSNKRSFINMLVSFIFIAFIGYIIHIASHHFIFTNIYNDYPVICKNIPILDNCIRYLTWFLDFHHITHHNSDVNKEFKNQVLEAINNFVMQGAFSGFLYYMVDWRMFLFWGILYASCHIINYTYLEPSVHRDHHIDIHSNYGIDIFDILMGTKYDWNDIENYNHYSINIIIITIITYYIL